MGHWYPCFGHQVTSTLDFKAKVDLLLPWFVTCAQRIPHIHVWCNTGRPLGRRPAWQPSSFYHLLIYYLDLDDMNNNFAIAPKVTFEVMTSCKLTAMTTFCYSSREKRRWETQTRVLFWEPPELVSQPERESHDGEGASLVRSGQLGGYVGQQCGNSQRNLKFTSVNLYSKGLVTFSDVAKRWFHCRSNLEAVLNFTYIRLLLKPDIF